MVYTDTTPGSVGVLSSRKMKMNNWDSGWWCWTDEDAENDDRNLRSSEQIRVDIEECPCQIATLTITKLYNQLDANHSIECKLKPGFHSNARNARKALRNKKYASKIKSAQETQ